MCAAGARERHRNEKKKHGKHLAVWKRTTTSINKQIKTTKSERGATKWKELFQIFPNIFYRKWSIIEDFFQWNLIKREKFKFSLIIVNFLLKKSCFSYNFLLNFPKSVFIYKNLMNRRIFPDFSELLLWKEKKFFNKLL